MSTKYKPQRGDIVMYRSATGEDKVALITFVYGVTSEYDTYAVDLHAFNNMAGVQFYSKVPYSVENYHAWRWRDD